MLFRSQSLCRCGSYTLGIETDNLSLVSVKDSYRHKGMRNALIEILKEKGITDIAVLSAIQKIPRHFFLDGAFLEKAYEDIALQIGSGQTISQPYTVARQSELLEIQAGDKVLEIGTGSGYQASVLAEMGAQVYTIERHKALSKSAGRMFFKLKYFDIKYTFGDGYLGWGEYAPYDKIIITAAAPYVPDALLDQLKIGGLMVIPLDTAKGDQVMKRILKLGEDSFKEEKFETYRFVKMLQGTEG